MCINIIIILVYNYIIRMHHEICNQLDIILYIYKSMLMFLQHLQVCTHTHNLSHLPPPPPTPHTHHLQPSATGALEQTTNTRVRYLCKLRENNQMNEKKRKKCASWYLYNLTEKSWLKNKSKTPLQSHRKNWMNKKKKKSVSYRCNGRNSETQEP